MLTLISFALTAGITITHWREIGRDTEEFYNFANKTWGDIFILYSLVLAVVVVHEFAHAYVSKHYGSRVTAMGFALVYLTPALYTDTTEADVMSSSYERFVVTIAGVWSELMICAIATFVWWGTAPDTPIHNGAYFLMMITGFVSVLLNWNPLMKLDGYHMLCELVGIPDLKESSTAFVSAWVKKHIWRLPVEVPYVPLRRRPGFAVYALLSGAYSYTVLYIVARFVGNVVRNFSPEWGFVPEIAVALLIFRSRIRSLVNFMKFVYLDKKDRAIAWFSPQHSLALAALLILFLLLPLWHDSVTGRFMLEPLQTATIRARVPGTVTQLFVEEGQRVSAGQPLATLRNLPMQSEYEEARARLSMASERANAASLHYRNMHRDQGSRTACAQTPTLTSKCGVADQLPNFWTRPYAAGRRFGGELFAEGSPLLQVADVSQLRARIYVSEYDLHMIQNSAQAKLEVQGLLKKWQARIIPCSGAHGNGPQAHGKRRIKGNESPSFLFCGSFCARSRIHPQTRDDRSRPCIWRAP